MLRIHHTTCPLCGSDDIALHLKTKDYSISQEAFELWQCGSCSFTFTQDAPAPADIGQYYQSEEYISHSDTKEGFVNRLYHLARDYMLGRKYRLLKRFVGQGSKVMDYGAGTGYFVDYLQRKGYDVDGVEIDENARQYGVEKFGIQMHAPAFITEDVQENSYAAITMWHVLEHLYDPIEDLKRFNTLLKEAGHLIIAVPNRVSADAAHYGTHWAAYDVPRHLWHFSPATMEQMTAKAGFELLETHHMPMDPFYVSIMSNRYKTGGGLISGAIQGGRSFMKSSFNPRKGSSVIYVLRKVD